VPKRFFIFALAGFFITASLVCAQAKGRRPENDDDVDKFPDYNRVEMHPKRKDTLPPPETGQPAPAPPSKSSLNAPLNFSPDDDDKPKPPPKAVPLPSGASEPPLPDDMMGTLVPSTTGQK
jgi:hypothetical protein